MPEPLRDRDWKTLLSRIEKGRCTPIIGDGVHGAGFPTHADIAQRWVKQHEYPHADTLDLAQVAQFVSVVLGDPLRPKEHIIDLIKSAPPFDPNAANDPHNILARLPFPVYITTNYDDAMTRALAALPNTKPHRELCRWHRALRSEPSIFDRDTGFDPDPSNPVVYHLYGYDAYAESLVLTEDDYLDYLANLAMNNHDSLPSRIRRALAEPSLLFIGYRLETVTFRVLFRGIINVLKGLGRTLNLAVQVLPGSDIQLDYLEAYFEDFTEVRVKIYWGQPADFAAELEARWEDYTHGN